MAPDAASLRLCQATGQIGTITETFIRAHHDQLPFTVEQVELGSPSRPYLRTIERPIFPRTVPFQILRRAEFSPVKTWMNRQYVTAFARYLRRQKIDVVLAEYGTVGVAARRSCVRAGVPLVVHFHGFDAHRRDLVERMSEEYHWLFRDAAAVVAVSRAMRAQLIQLGCPERKIHVIPCGVDTDHFHLAPHRIRSTAARPFHFIFVGRFVNKKAPIHLLLAFKRCLTRLDARLTMAGDGPFHELAREVVTALRLEDRVALPGSVPYERVRELLIEADCYVQHSILALSGDSEGSPVVVLEAAAASLPVVATCHAGMTESVIDGSTGYLVAEHDVDAMGDRMAELGLDHDLAHRFGQAGRSHMCAHYSLDVSITALAELILSCRRPARA